VTEPEELVFRFPISVLFPSTIIVTFTFDDLGSASTLGATVDPTCAETTGAPAIEALDFSIVEVAFVGDEVDEFTDNALETFFIEGEGIGMAGAIGEGDGDGVEGAIGEGDGEDEGVVGAIGDGEGVAEALALGNGVGVGVGSAITITGWGDVLGTKVEPDDSSCSCPCCWGCL
jgi:hypothetical protein